MSKCEMGEVLRKHKPRKRMQAGQQKPAVCPVMKECNRDPAKPLDTQIISGVAILLS